MKIPTLAERQSDLSAALHVLSDERKSLENDLRWYDSADIGELEAAFATQGDELGAMKQKLSELADKLDREKSETRKLAKKAKLEWKPTSWFSQSRYFAKVELRERRRSVATLKIRRDKQKKLIDRAQRRLKKAEGLLRKAENFDPATASARIGIIDGEVTLLQVEFEEVSERQNELLRRLAAPLAEVLRLEGEIVSICNQDDDLDDESQELRTRIEDAERFEARLTAAATGYDRKLLHDDCEDRLGDPSPRRVIQQARGELRRVSRQREALAAQTQGVKRSLSKLQARIEHATLQAARTIRAVVIDGSNLCFRGQQFVGLVALQAVVRQVAATLDVTVVFDASIRGRLRVSKDDEIQQQLPGTTVHVVASRRKADETILRLADDDFIYVISNDRFVEYPEMAAVLQDRLIRHEIVKNRVMIHDLGVDERML